MIAATQKGNSREPLGGKLETVPVLLPNLGSCKLPQGMEVARLPPHPQSHLTFSHVILRFKAMEVQFSPDTETLLKHFADDEGKPAAQVVEESMARMLKRRAQFLEGVDRGIAAADRGEIIDHEEVEARINRLFES
jgi:predicted transcriptional regulator